MKNYINKGTAQKLIKLGIFESQINYGRNRSIFDLLEKLPKKLFGSRLIIHYIEKKVAVGFYNFKLGMWHKDFIIKHKSLAEALAMLLIKLHKEGVYENTT